MAKLKIFTRKWNLSYCTSEPTINTFLATWVRFFSLFLSQYQMQQYWLSGPMEYKGSREYGENLGQNIVSPVMSADIFLSPSETILQDFSTTHKPAVPSGILTLMGQPSEWKLISTELVIEKAHCSWRQCGMISGLWGLEDAFAVTSWQVF